MSMLEQGFLPVGRREQKPAIPADQPVSSATVALVASSVAAHEADTTGVHGIADTSALVLTGDARLSDARTPLAHAASHASGGTDAITVSQSQVTNLATALAGKVDDTGDTISGTLTTSGIRQKVAVKAVSYTLTATDEVVVFTATATASLPAASGTGQTFRVVCRAGTLTIDGNGSDTVKGSATQVLFAGEDLILTDTATGVWE